jgi:CDP-glycerol glycerophosphotransferase
VGSGAFRRLRSVYRSVRGRLTNDRTKVKFYHRVLTRLPIRRDLIVFESNLGKQYADSPKYIYEALRRHHRRYTPVWSYAKSPAGFPSDAKLVRRGSWSYYVALARAAFWVDNQGFPDGLRKRRKTTYIQTTQGSTVTPSGLDDPAVKSGTAGQRRRLQRSVERFDTLLVRSEYDVSTLAAGLRTNAELVRCGSPSNDILVNGVEHAQVAKSRRQLGIRADGRRVLLYAPTLRRGTTGSNPALFDLHTFVERLGDRYVLLIRPEYRSKFVVPHELAHAVRTASHIPDVNQVLLLADVLITDYSSLMFDYALLDRPMILYVPDGEDPTKGRGTHLDLATDGPGPLVHDEATLFDILDTTLTEMSEKFAQRRRDFVARYGEYDKGTAADAVVDRFFVRGRNG